MKTVQILSKEPTRRDVHWVQGQSKDCTGPECTYCKTGSKPAARWSVDVDTDEGQLVWEMSNAVLNVVEDIAELEGALEYLTLRVKRTGSGTSTRYTVIPIRAREGEAP